MKKSKSSYILNTLYGAAVLALIFLAESGQAFATTPVAGCSASVPDWLKPAKDIIQEPVGWIQWLSGIGTVLALAVIGLKFKSSKGRQDKIDEAYKQLWYTLGGGVLIFGSSSAAGWYLKKVNCNLALDWATSLFS